MLFKFCGHYTVLVFWGNLMKTIMPHQQIITPISYCKTDKNYLQNVIIIIYGNRRRRIEFIPCTCVHCRFTCRVMDSFFLRCITHYWVWALRSHWNMSSILNLRRVGWKTTDRAFTRSTSLYTTFTNALIIFVSSCSRAFQIRLELQSCLSWTSRYGCIDVFC